MAGLRRAIELAIGEEDLAELRAIARPPMEPSSGSPCESMVSRHRDFSTVSQKLGQTITSTGLTGLHKIELIYANSQGRTF